MSIKPHTAQSAQSVAYAPWTGGVLELAGRDAGAFAQAQLMNDVRGLDDAAWQWNGWLSAKGRVIALGALLRLSVERWWMILPDHPADELAERMRRFVFRSKVELIARTDLALLGRFTGHATASGACAAIDGADCVTLDLSARQARALLILPRADETVTASAAASDERRSEAVAMWALEDLAHGLPRLSASSRELHTPQMLGLDRLRAYSVKKGCYPGQEIVARTHFLGQAKRGLRRLQGDTPFVAGEALVAAPQKVGEVLCAASLGTRHEALAVLPLEGLADVLQRDAGGDARVLGFDDGLSR